MQESLQDLHQCHEEIAEYIKILRKWKTSEQKTVSNVLLRIKQSIDHKYNEADLRKLQQARRLFHIQINKLQNAKLVKQSWFNCSIQGKKHLEKLIQQKSKQVYPKLRSKCSFQQTACPQKYLQGKPMQNQLVFQLIYRNFILNMKQHILQQQQNKIAEFVQNLVIKIFDKFGFGKGTHIFIREKMNDDVAKSEGLFNRLQKLAQILKMQNSNLAKQQMIYGSINIDQIVACNPNYFYENFVKTLRQQRLKKQRIKQNKSKN